MSTATAPPSPYLGLRAFTADDADRFFARELWTKIVVENVVASRLTVLYGESGVGKTSLLQAGVEHELRERGRGRFKRSPRPTVVPICFRTWQGEPVRPLIEAVWESAATLPEAVQERVKKDGGRVVLILDQFEEYLLYHGRDEGPDSLPGQLARTVCEPGLPVSVLISIREDALSGLDPLKRAMPELFDNMLHLGRVDRESAAVTITGPIDWFNEQFARGDERVEIDPKLVEAVLGGADPAKHALKTSGDEKVVAGDGGANGQTVELAYLQLVLERLWTEGRRRGLRRLGMEMLAELPGGAEEIVRDHVRSAVEGLSDEERNLAADAFRYLVTPSGSKIAYTVDDLAVQVGSSPEALSTMVQKLSSADARVLRPLGVNTAAGVKPGVEIYHDKLANPILHWRSEHVEEQDRERLRVEAREEERKRLRKIRAIALFVAVTAVATATTALLLVALREKRLADSRGIAAAASSQLNQDPELSLLLALEAVDAGSTTQATEALRAALVESRVRHVLRGHADSVTPIAYTPDGKTIVTAGKDGTARVWDARSGKAKPTVIRAGPNIGDIALTPDGSRVVLTTNTRTEQWSLETGERMGQPLETHAGNVVFRVAVSPKDDLAATANADNTIRLWRLGGAGRVLGTHGKGGVNSVAFSPGGQQVVSTSSDGARIWTVGSTARVPLRTLGSRPMNDATYNHDGRLVVTAGEDGRAQIWEAATGRLLHTLVGHKRAVTSTAFAPGDDRVATGSADQTARIWDPRTGTTLAVLSGHTGTVKRVVFPDKNGRRVATASQDGTARIWVAASGRSTLVLRGHAGAVQRVAFSPDARFVATSSIDRTARIWEVDPLRRPSSVLPAPSGSPLGVAFAGSGDEVGYAASDGSLRVLDSDSGRAVHKLPGSGAGAKRASFSEDGERAAILDADGEVRVSSASEGRALSRLRPAPGTREVEIVADGEALTTLADGVAQIWSADLGKPLARLEHNRDRLTNVAVSDDGKLAITTGSAGHAKVWSVGDRRQIRDLAPDAEPQTGAAFSHDGKLAAIASEDGTVRIYDAATRTYRTQLSGHSGPVRNVAFSPDSTIAVTSGSDGTARVWNPRTGRSLAFLGEHGGPVRSASFSRDGRFIVDVSEDGYARIFLWGTGNGALVAKLDGTISDSEHGIEFAQFDESGQLIAAGAPGQVRIYSCEVCGGEEDLQALARSRVSRSLTDAERDRFGVGD